MINVTEVRPENDPCDPSQLNMDIMSSKMELMGRAAITRPIVTKAQKHIIWCKRQKTWSPATSTMASICLQAAMLAVLLNMGWL